MRNCCSLGSPRVARLIFAIFVATTCAGAIRESSAQTCAPLTAQVLGGGPAKSDCYAGFTVRAASASGNTVTCTDGDPACDLDGACNDSCSFQVTLCPNLSGVTGCTAPGTLKSLKEVGKKKNRVGLTAPLTGTVCGSPVNVVVPVKIKRGKKLPGKHPVVVAAISTTKPKKDMDTLILSCEPRATGVTCPTRQNLGRLTFTFSPGTTSCGGAGLTKHCTNGAAGTNGVGGCAANADCGAGSPPGTCAGGPPPSPPVSGELDAADGSKIADLGAGCLYFGGSQGTTVPPGPIPSGGKTTVDVSAVTGSSSVDLAASTGTGPADCTQGPAATKHCLNCTGSKVCTSNTDCARNDTDCPGADTASPCQPDTKCLFGPPLPIFNPTYDFLSTCVVNNIASDVAGTANLATGCVDLTSYALTSVVYLTGTTYAGQPCPMCVSATCNGGPRVGQSCTPTGPAGTTIECPPDESSFLGPLSVNLAPLSTTTTTKSAADGIFCTDKFCKALGGSCSTDADCGSGSCVAQEHAGAFGVSFTRKIVTNGVAAGSLEDGQAHDATLAYVFCIPPPGEPASSSADLPGPGAVTLPGTLQFTAQ